MLQAFLTGLAVQGSLILAIGPQNVFVLRQGLTRDHVLPVVLFCAASDAALIFAGVAGFGAVVDAAPWMPRAMALAGAAFLAVYGAQRAFAAWRGHHPLVCGASGGTLQGAIGTAAALTWLNPHVYLDTLALMGAIGAGLGGDAWAFALGGTLASGAFFAALGYGAQVLAPVMRSSSAWRILDAVTAAVMWAVAAGLLVAT
ncbi:L-lysine exporter family protein LysE/ArgO [Hasllibacter halocynthiae]|uniref:L-lysine exporter family protein LysE/ArgO n=1 Tax=Hasllibacter halocynthiae TaxID=595589 RepID=A0A2T0X8A0_9RHOB|nr:LysE family transporter [Hasllibacter halocynthiae]PRY95147.1 L-lysine exporter family protein LysE/ArgO [Hasllibacter halocynthiae]